MRQTVVVEGKITNDFGLRYQQITEIEYRLSSKPLRQLRRHELPTGVELESYETEDDIWFRHNGNLYNVNEFCVIGAPKLDGPRGGAQCASNGYFMIAAYDGKIYSVSISETRSQRELFKRTWSGIPIY